MSKLIEKVVVEQEVTGPIADLVYFARYVMQLNMDHRTTDDQLIKLAREFWDTQHGEE